MLTEDYTLLGVSPDSTTPELMAAWRRLSKSLHPDATGGCRVREERFKRVSSAYARIRAAQHAQPVRRPEPNQGRSAPAESPHAESPQPGSRQESRDRHGSASTGRWKTPGGGQGDHRARTHQSGMGSSPLHGRPWGAGGRQFLVTDHGLALEIVLASAIPVVSKAVIALRKASAGMPHTRDSLVSLEEKCRGWARTRIHGSAEQEMQALSDVLAPLRRMIDSAIARSDGLIDGEAAAAVLISRGLTTRLLGHLGQAREEMFPGTSDLRRSKAAAAVCTWTLDVQAAALTAVARAAARSVGALESSALGAGIDELTERALTETGAARVAKLAAVLRHAGRLLDRPFRSTPQRRLAQANIDTALFWVGPVDLTVGTPTMDPHKENGHDTRRGPKH